MVEEHRRDRQQLRIEFAEDVVRVIGPVVIADSGVVTAYYKMRTPIVLADESVKNCLAGPGISHSGGIDRQQRSGPGKVMLKHHLVTSHSYVGRNIVRFGLAHQGV